MTSIIHAWEEHVLGIFILILGTNHEVGVLFVCRGFLLALIDGFALRHDGLAVLTVLLKGYL